MNDNNILSENISLCIF